jgi:hypothetical protein
MLYYEGRMFTASSSEVNIIESHEALQEGCLEDTLFHSIFKYLSFKRGRILCLLCKSGRDLTSMTLHSLFRNRSDLMSIYKHNISLAPEQFLLLPPSIYLCLGSWSGLHCALECFIPMGGGYFQNMWDSAVHLF